MLSIGPFMKRYLTGALCCAALLGFEVARAQAPASAPAVPESGEAGVQSRIEVPVDTAEGVHRYRCDATITTGGEPQEVDCYGPRTAATDPLLRAITRAVREARYQPAKHNGNAIEASMTLSVLVKVQAQQALVGVFPNDGEHWTTFGTNYVSPQRIKGGYGSMTYSNAIQENNRASAKFRIRVDTSGEVTALTVEEQSGTFLRKEMATLQKRIKAMKFLPGQHKGQPLEMDHILIYNRRQHAQPDFRPMYGTGG
jgi:hypothetical protein